MKERKEGERKKRRKKGREKEKERKTKRKEKKQLARKERAVIKIQIANIMLVRRLSPLLA